MVGEMSTMNTGIAMTTPVFESLRASLDGTTRTDSRHFLGVDNPGVGEEATSFRKERVNSEARSSSYQKCGLMAALIHPTETSQSSDPTCSRPVT